MADLRTEPEYVWIFNGVRGHFPSGVFHTKSDAEEWIKRMQLSGTLTKYPVGIPVYDWAVQRGYFQPKTPQHEVSHFIGRFSCAQMEHYHYEGGTEGSEIETKV